MQVNTLVRISRDYYRGIGSIVFIGILCSMVTSCGTSRIATQRIEIDFSSIDSILTVDNEYFTGFLLMDELGNTLYEYQADKLFTPASNMKIYTYWASRQVLGDSFPAYQLAYTGDTLYFRGSGDPYLLSRWDMDSLLIKELNHTDRDHIKYCDSHFQSERYGSGWAWDDSQYFYQKELSTLPIFENADSTARKPVQNTDSINISLLDSLVNVTIIKTDECPNDLDWETVYHHNTDSIYRELMVYSDNFIAEQLLLMTSQRLLDTMSITRVIDTLKKSLFSPVADDIRWVDGSGLSRYNLISPRSTCWVLRQILDSHSVEEIRSIFPHGMVGTLDSVFLTPRPFIFAKTGTLSNNFNISGYLITSTGRPFIFSLMSNHYLRSKSMINYRNYVILREIYDVLAKKN